MSVPLALLDDAAVMHGFGLAYARPARPKVILYSTETLRAAQAEQLFGRAECIHSCLLRKTLLDAPALHVYAGPRLLQRSAPKLDAALKLARASVREKYRKPLPSALEACISDRQHFVLRDTVTEMSRVIEDVFLYNHNIYGFRLGDDCEVHDLPLFGPRIHLVLSPPNRVPSSFSHVVRELEQHLVAKADLEPRLVAFVCKLQALGLLHVPKALDGALHLRKKTQYVKFAFAAESVDAWPALSAEQLEPVAAPELASLSDVKPLLFKKLKLQYFN